MFAVNSSNISHLGYANGIMKARFRTGKEYEYYDVPADVFKAVLIADSVGKAFSELIKGIYKYKEVGQ